MLEVQARGMQHRTRRRQHAARPTINNIADNTVAESRKMYSNLMGATSFESALDQ